MLSYNEIKDAMKTRDTITYSINNFVQMIMDAITAAPMFKHKWPAVKNLKVDDHIVDSVIHYEGTDKEYLQLIFAVNTTTFILAIPGTIIESGRQDIMNYVNYSLHQGQYTSHMSPNVTVINIGLPNP